MKKILIFIGCVIVTGGMVTGLAIFEIKDIPVGGSLLGIALGFYLPHVWRRLVDFTDLTPWQRDLRKLMRGKVLKKTDNIRISFAYLFRIKVDGKYLLVLNGRGTNKFQPVGGAYKFDEQEQKYLKNQCGAFEDGNISQDKLTHRDYRLQIPVKNLRKFIKRFNETNHRENVADLSREFNEEVIDTGILKFNKIKYRYCGRHFTNIEYSRYFECYELLMADIVELVMDDSQLESIRLLVNKESDKYRFATAKEIETCGIISGTENLLEVIGDHSYKILEEHQNELQEYKLVGDEFSIALFR